VYLRVSWIYKVIPNLCLTPVTRHKGPRRGIVGIVGVILAVTLKFAVTLEPTTISRTQ
jgi:hypothetical protein